MWGSRTRKHREAGCGRPEDGGVWTAKTVKRPPQQPAPPQYANYWAPLTRKRHILPHPAQPQYTNHWALQTRSRHQQEHRPQRPTESSDPTQHAKGRTGDCPGPRKETTTRQNVTQGGTSCTFYMKLLNEPFGSRSAADEAELCRRPQRVIKPQYQFTFPPFSTTIFSFTLKPCVVLRVLEEVLLMLPGAVPTRLDFVIVISSSRV